MVVHVISHEWHEGINPSREIVLRVRLCGVVIRIVIRSGNPRSAEKVRKHPKGLFLEEKLLKNTSE
jgi:hypothetical protein